MPASSDTRHSRWKHARGDIQLALRSAGCFQMDPIQLKSQGFGNHSRYLQRLQFGVGMGGRMGSRLLTKRVENAERHAVALMRSQDIVHTVEDQEELQRTAMWMQGDANLATATKMRMRFKLRHAPAIQKVLAAFWDAILRASGKHGDDFDAKIGREDYFALYERVYVVLLDDWDPRDAEETISSDWLSDLKGQATLAYEAFGDSLFELADTCK